MVDRAQIRRYARDIGRTFRAERVILFGSYAYGRPTEDSDVDVLVVMDHDKRRNADQALEIDLALNRSFPMDLIVRRPAELRERVAMGDSFLKTILQDGQVLYERRG
jgi:uncharacterized protein